jgi:hypothetical protein
MDVVGDAGFYGFGALISAVVLAFALWRMTRRPAVPLEDQGPWVPVSRTTPMAAELDPRWDPEESGSEEGAGTDTQEPGKAPA